MSSPSPRWFGDPERPLFGVFHPPIGEARSVVAVLCYPFGYDLMIAHQSYRHLTRKLCAAGVGVLRFDVHGTGDSAGEDVGADRLEAWLASVDAARREALRVSGAEHVALFGLRMGAVLALASAQRDPVDTLVLVGPPASGKAYVRELRVARKLQRPVPRPDDPEGGAPDDENFGFLMDAATREAVGKLDFASFARPPARRALVIARDDVSGGEQALVDRLSACGVDARLSTTPGYTLALRGDPHTHELPDEAWAEVAGFVASQASHASQASRAERSSGARSTEPVHPAPVGTPTQGVREEAFFHEGLFGVLSEPVAESARTSTAIVLLNIGANHHIGSNRMYVRWARHWASLGFRVLRFDHAGVGDSPTGEGRGEKEIYTPHAMKEASRMIDLLAARGARRFVVAGLCSGAYVAFNTALADARVSGVILLNQPTFHWKEGDSLVDAMLGEMLPTAAYKGKAMQLETYKRLLRGEIRVRAIARTLAGRLWARVATAGTAIGTRAGILEEPDEIARGFQALSRRGCETLVVVGSRDIGRETIIAHLGPGAAKMKGHAGFRLHVIDGTDHVFTPRTAQDELARVLTEHVVNRLG